VEERGIGVAVVIVILVVIAAVVGVACYFLLKGKTTGASTKPLSAYAINAKDVPWLENLVENEVSGVIENEFSASQLSGWGENELYEKGIYQLNPNLAHFTSGKGSVLFQLVIRFKDVDGAINCYEYAEPLSENILARQVLTAQGRMDITPELLSATISQALESENLTFVTAGDKGFIISVRDNFIMYNFGGLFVLGLQHSNLVEGLVIAENSYLGWSVSLGRIVSSITKNNALAIAKTAYNKMIS
jgi:hypothetical protein